MATITFALPPIASAHDPALHGFRLVTFKRPIAAPVFSLRNLAGDVVKLEQFRGQYVVLNFWATWCPPCVKEMPSMERLQQHFKDKRFRVVAISLDKEPKQKVQSFVSKLNLTFSILLDPKGIAALPYGARDLPSTFILNTDGQVIAAAKGERDWHSEEAVSYLNELLKQ
ncbi:MAG: peroxiredoxin family protein [Acidiferrobacterales bacterium]